MATNSDNNANGLAQASSAIQGNHHSANKAGNKNNLNTGNQQTPYNNVNSPRNNNAQFNQQAMNNTKPQGRATRQAQPPYNQRSASFQQPVQQQVPSRFSSFDQKQRSVINNQYNSDPFSDLDIPSSYNNQNRNSMNYNNYVHDPRSANVANNTENNMRQRKNRKNKSNGKTKMTAWQQAQVVKNTGNKPGLILRMRMALETARTYISEGEFLNLGILICDWIYRNKIPVICISAIIFLLIGFFINRYVSWGGGLALVIIGAIISRIDDDHEGFPFIISGILIYLIPFLV